MSFTVSPFTDYKFLAALLIPTILVVFLILSLNISPSVTWVINAPYDAFWYLIFMPVIEELAFRGYLQSTLTKFKSGGWPSPAMFSFANIMTSTIFSAIHFITYFQALAVLTFIPSLIFGYFKDKYQSILPGLIIHIFYNFGFISLFAYSDL